MKHKVLICGGLLLIAAALCLTAYNLAEEQRAAVAAEKALQELAEPSPAAPELPEPEPEPTPEPEPPTPAYILDPEMEMPTKEIDGVAYIGTLEIPSLSLTLPVISQWSDSRLRLAPCRYKGSAYLGDLIIAGHNYRTHFGGLAKLEIGDAVYFTDMDGNRFAYTVSGLDELAGTAIEEMEAGEWDLTLFTCTLGGKSRFTVRCTLDASN